MTIYTSTKTKRQVGNLFKLYEDGQVNETTVRGLNIVLGLEVNQLEKDLAATEKDLGEFERQYNMTTADFFRQWQAGKIGDHMDFVEWASLTQMADNLRKRLDFLTSENQK
jgi:hypothetical protein